LVEDYLVISVDESNFRSDNPNQRQWEFNPLVKGMELFPKKAFESYQE
jgi:hypothetical protein